jgi:Ca2+-binding EF-hand superfamily protein
MRNFIPVFVSSALAMTAVMGDDQERSTASEEATFKSLDKDSDQRLSKTEAAGDQMLNDHFAMIDADADGYLTKREYTAHLKEMKEPKKEY